jgi:GH25 family lysozyme M1 (1,4-beta-N-acetylmuramidase)
VAITGIDVSRHQGAVDFGAVKRAGYDFAIIKATESTSYSYVGWYREHAPKVEAAGLVLGAYHFLRGDRDPAKQARYFVSTVGSFRNRIAVVDVETAANGTKPTGSQVRAFAAEFRRLVPGHVLVIYTGRWYWRDTIGNPTGADIGPLWHSEYETSQAEVNDGPEADSYGGWTACTLWQWTSSGSCPGVAGRCDLNILRRGTLADLTGSTQEDDMPLTKADKGIIKEAVAEQLDAEARRVFGITSYDQVLELTYQYAREAAKNDTAKLAAAIGAELAARGIEVDIDPEAVEAAMRRVFADAATP